ncbi:MAG TPA: flagellar operon protein YvyF [Thermoclostridium sp.]|nr:flagellar operon protein YvyF [Thermoclostridium sp.]HPU45937.1 flagellar operon protein YvyF [Thermoclostridium sp.]
MPEIRNCKRCRKIFTYITGPQLCEVCKKQEEEEYEKVRKFLREYPGATIQEVSQATEVSQQLIYKFLKEGRLEVATDSPIALLCENCGVRITSGRFCVNCSKRLANEMIATGRMLNDSLNRRSNAESDDKSRGLRYLDQYRRDRNH